MTTSTWWRSVKQLAFISSSNVRSPNDFPRWNWIALSYHCYWNEKILILCESQNYIFIQKLFAKQLSYIHWVRSLSQASVRKVLILTKNTSVERWKWSMSCDESHRDWVEDALCHDQQWASCKIMTIDGMLQPSRMMFCDSRMYLLNRLIRYKCTRISACWCLVSSKFRSVTVEKNRIAMKSKWGCDSPGSKPVVYYLDVIRKTIILVKHMECKCCILCFQVMPFHIRTTLSSYR